MKFANFGKPNYHQPKALPLPVMIIKQVTMCSTTHIDRIVRCIWSSFLSLS